ncbi:MAG: hypothetical protein EAZ97_09215 [Bacteroidetes bacterium]|nr:MAG: hypothetical protein EAZ97_09215 [Bacteroidota bacterium]
MKNENEGGFNENLSEVNKELSCKNCGSVLKYKIGSKSIACTNCGTENEIIAKKNVKIEELDFKKALEKGADEGEKQKIATVKCPACGATSSLKPNVVTDDCAFCGTSLVIKNDQWTTSLKPKSVLPFAIKQEQGMTLFREWVDSLWFAPNDLTSRAQTTEKLKGMYLPYWTYDSETYSTYTGERGDNYTVTENYKDENGNTKQREVTKTKWSNRSGDTERFFNDVLVVATKSLPKNYLEALEPWDLKSLVPYDDQYLSGFQTETYQVDLKTGFEVAKDKMDEVIKQDVRRDIGGDSQRIHKVNTKHSDITFKHILLPIWICAYTYNGEVFRFLVNGRTGEVQGERPYSWIKITLAVLAVLAIIGAIYYFAYLKK